MLCKLTTRLLGEGREETLSEREFDQERITIGRGAANDVVLKDPARVVSTKHAEIRTRNGAWCVLDVGSTNGTMLNGVRIPVREEQVLRDGDRLTVGPFYVLFEIRQPHQAGAPDSQTVVPVVVPSGTSPTDPQRLLYEMRREVAEADCEAGESLEMHLEQRLRHVLAGYDHDKAQSVVQSLKAAALQIASDAVGSRKEPPAPRSKPVAPSPAPQRYGQSSVAGDFARRVYDHFNVRETVLDSDQMARQIISVLQAVFAGLADAVRGRREFQKEFEVEATRILAWTPNPIKHAENAAEIGSVLLDPASVRLTDEQAIASLREVFQDLTLHQLGLMAGFRECVRGLLKELDPELLGKPPKGESSGKGLGLLGGGNVRSEAAAWRRYVEKHRQLMEEEVKVFERILAPYFAKGYLSVHKTRRRS